MFIHLVAFFMDKNLFLISKKKLLKLDLSSFNWFKKIIKIIELS